MKREDIVKRDNLIVNLLRAHKGKENAITGDRIREYLEGYGYKYGKLAFKTIISKLRNDRRLPICYQSGGANENRGGVFLGEKSAGIKRYNRVS